MKNSRVYRFSTLALILCGAFYLCYLVFDVTAKLGDPKLRTWLLGGKLPSYTGSGVLHCAWGLES